MPAGNVTLLNESRAKTANVVDDPKTTVVKNDPVYSYGAAVKGMAVF